MRQFQLYDSMSRSIRPFVPINPPRVGLFVCGMTPYAEAHIGHGRTAVTFDVVARALRHWGYRVFYVQNVTNLDDKIIARAGEAGMDPLLLAERHFEAYRASMIQLGVTSVNHYPFATDYVPEILRQIGDLVARGAAYAARGSVYFDVGKFPDYGRLSGSRIEAQRPGARIDPDPAKLHPEDFALWKATIPGEPTWESPWGPGRPGWHIEDTAITLRLLGERYDLHGGGLELKFPHHEAEIALAESATGAAPLVNYWMHAGLLTMKGEKMAKSLGNVVRLDTILDRVGPGVLRFFYLNAVYRNPLDYEEGKSLEEAAEAYGRLLVPARQIALEIARSGSGREGRELPGELAEEAAAVVTRMDGFLADDFNTREALGALFGWTRRIAPLLPELPALSTSALLDLEQPYRWAADLLGLGAEMAEASPVALDPLVQVVLAARSRARARGDYAESDRLRAELQAAGIHVEDHGAGSRWSFSEPPPG
ncbi:MAG: cysteine--tRNA ligase [Thermoplasmata archaeon]